MRVLHLHSGNIYGGIERALETIACTRPSSNVEHAAALCFEGRFADGWRAAGRPLHLLGEARLSRPLSVLRARRALTAVLEREAPDVVVTHGAWARSVFAPNLTRRSMPHVAFQHAANAGSGWLDRMAARVRPDFVIYNSEFTRSNMAASFDGVDGAVCYLPVEPPAIDAEARIERRSRFGVTPDRVVLLQASRLEPWKGHAELLTSLAALRANPRWTLWIAGGASTAAERAHRQRLDTLVRTHELDGRVAFLGERRDVPTLLSSADVLCQPNTEPEPFGIAFVEAMYAGVPVVTSRLGAAEEVVGECGVLTAPGSISELTAALQRLISSDTDRRALGLAGPARARRLCDPATQTAQLEQLFANAISRWPQQRIRVA